MIPAGFFVHSCHTSGSFVVWLYFMLICCYIFVFWRIFAEEDAVKFVKSSRKISPKQKHDRKGAVSPTPGM